MTEDDGRELAALPKWGEPNSDWSQDRPNTLTNGFGVLDVDGKTIKGLHVEFEVFTSPTLGLTKFVFSLMRYELGRVERAFQLEINGRPGLRRTDHNYSHEHYGEAKFKADESWAGAGFVDAVKRLCDAVNLTLTVEMPDYESFKLR